MQRKKQQPYFSREIFQSRTATCGTACISCFCSFKVSFQELISFHFFFFIEAFYFEFYNKLNPPFTTLYVFFYIAIILSHLAMLIIYVQH